MDNYSIRWITEPIYDSIDEISLSDEELIPVKKDSKWGFININGTITIEPRFDYALSFSEGLACVQINNKWGYIDSTGQIIIEPQFDDIPGNFKEGLVRIAKFDKEPALFPDSEIITTGSKFGYADREGNIIIEPQYTQAEDFSEGLAAVKIEDKYGYINREGVTVIDFIFDHAESFYMNRSVVCFKGKWGIIGHP
ncbi:MAG TPA: WG repeat-containing protein [Spirochaetota bacterium]|jgi:hypothetical protein|nr:WG repeat-containing protein [Spirochaetota bacterium]